MAENNHYKTANTALATYLQVEGFTLVEIITQPHAFIQGELEAVFLFENNQKIPDCVRLWQTGTATGNLPVFYGTYRAIVKKAKRAVEVARL